MGTTTETPPAPPVAASVNASPPPASESKPLAAVVPRVPRYRRLDKQCVANLTKLDPGSVKATDLPARIQELAQNVFVESRDVFAPGAYVGFELKVPKRDVAYHANGVVRWISDDPMGLGLQLFEVTSGKAAAADAASSSAPAASGSTGSKFSLPQAAAVGELLGGLLGKTIEAKPGAKWEPTADAPATLAAFGPDDGPTSCLWVFDMSASIFAGAALTMMPPEEAKQAVKAKELKEGIIENVREIFNVGANLFNGGSLKLKEAYVTSKEMPDLVKQLMANSPGRLDLEITIPDYGKGNVTVIVS